MENVYENVKKELKPQAVKDALELMWSRINEPDNLDKINGAKEEAGNDMIEVMKLVFPLVVDIQVEAVGKFGFPRNKDGLRDFLVRANELLENDKDISEMLIRIRSIYLPSYA
ncbi:uncharacterized protein LOC110855423 [Folsomia candida]|uniref:Protein C10 n=1 Tax=Folsomia candida TaxID=158441 RepID=A0A226F5Y2_FOLCA|nr:uncharacterized protein LOC110855423 [Folsomia candida]OXA64601.1 Protein C10 [Folsomia candida]